MIKRKLFCRWKHRTLYKLLSSPCDTDKFIGWYGSWGYISPRPFLAEYVGDLGTDVTTYANHIMPWIYYYAADEYRSQCLFLRMIN